MILVIMRFIILLVSTNEEGRVSPTIDKQQQPVLKRAKSIVSSNSLSAFFTDLKSKQQQQQQQRDRKEIKIEEMDLVD